MTVRIITGDCRDKLRALPAHSIQCCVTSPPYFGLRDYGVAGQIGLEQTPTEFASELVGVFREVRRTLRDDGTLWLNLGDSYGKGKQLLGIPWRVAFALQADGWCLRSSIIWHKPNPMPESVKDRPTNAHELMFLFAKSEKYYFDAEAVKAPAAASTVKRAAKGYSHGGSNAPDRGDAGHVGRVFTDAPRNIRNVWTIPTHPFKGAHFATFPPDLIEPCILAGCPIGGTVLDPFGGAGTTALVAAKAGRDAILIELNPEYAAMAERRIRAEQLMFAEVVVEDQRPEAAE